GREREIVLRGAREDSLLGGPTGVAVLRGKLRKIRVYGGSRHAVDGKEQWGAVVRNQFAASAKLGRAEAARFAIGNAGSDLRVEVRLALGIALGRRGCERDEVRLRLCDGRLESSNRRSVRGSRVLQLRQLVHLQLEPLAGRKQFVVLRPANVFTDERAAHAGGAACLAGGLGGHVRNQLLRALPDRRRLSGD